MKKIGEKDALKKAGVDDKKQSQRFVETAERLETDTSGRPFHKAVRAISQSSDNQKAKG